MASTDDNFCLRGKKRKSKWTEGAGTGRGMSNSASQSDDDSVTLDDNVDDETTPPNSGIMSFMKNLLQKYEEIRGKDKNINGNLFWDVVVITTADKEQKKVFQAQIENKIARNELPTNVPYYVVSDPPGPKQGNGGSTLTALSFLHTTLGDDMYSKKIFLIHAGGQSKRMPSTSILGKIFSPIPYGKPIYQMLDLKLAMYMPFLSKMPCGVFLACADDMLVYNLGDIKDPYWSFPYQGFTALAHPSTVAIGTKHGVYIVENEENVDTMKRVKSIRCLGVLQKPSAELMYKRGAVLKRKNLTFPDGIIVDGNVAYTDSAFFFGTDVMKRLIRFHKDNSPITCEIDAYGDFLQALGPQSTNEYVNNISNVTKPTPSLIPTRQKIYDLLSKSEINLLLLNASKFVHIGTTKEYIHHFCFDRTFQDEMSLEKDVFNAWMEVSHGGTKNPKRMKMSDTSLGCVMHCCLPSASFIAENSVIEYCDFEVPVQIGQNTIVSSCAIEESDLEEEAEKVEIPPNIFLHSVPIKQKRNTLFVTVIFHIEDNLKKQAALAEAKKLPFLGYDVEDIVEYCNIKDLSFTDAPSPQKSAKGTEKDSKPMTSLWDIAVFPLETSMTRSLTQALQMLKAVQTKDKKLIDLSDSELVSMASILKRKDVGAMLSRREQLYTKISEHDTQRS